MRRTLTLLRVMMHVANDPSAFDSAHGRAAGQGQGWRYSAAAPPSSSRRLVIGKSPTMPPPPRRRLVLAGDVPRQLPSIRHQSSSVSHPPSAQFGGWFIGSTKCDTRTVRVPYRDGNALQEPFCFLPDDALLQMPATDVLVSDSFSLPLTSIWQYHFATLKKRGSI